MASSMRPVRADTLTCLAGIEPVDTVFVLGMLEKGADQKPHGIAEIGPFPLIQLFQMHPATTSQGVLQNLDVRPDVSRLRRLGPGKSFQAPGGAHFFDQLAVVHSC